MKKQKIHLPPEIQNKFREVGRKGGKIGGKATTPAKVEAARKNGLKNRERWERIRKGGHEPMQ